LEGFHRLLEAAPDDKEALRWAGSLEFAAGRQREAKGYLARYLQLGMGDFESHFYYGEILLGDGDRANSRKHFEASLRLAEQAPAKDVFARSVRAQALDRLGRTQEAIAQLAALLREQPDDKNIRADYAAVLLRAKRYEDAGRVLSIR
jgi:predicted Zn-dependent protease